LVASGALSCVQSCVRSAHQPLGVSGGAELTNPITIDGREALPAGAKVKGVVVGAFVVGGKYGKGYLRFFDRLYHAGDE
jgi:hypothetical protein